MPFSTFSTLHKHHLYLVPELFSTPKATPPPPQPLTTRNPLSVFVNQPVLNVSHQWNHTPHVLLCLLISLSITSSRSIRAPAGVRVPSVNHSPACGRSTLCLHHHRRALGWLHCLVTVSDAALNTGTEVSLRVPAVSSLCIDQEEG